MDEKMGLREKKRLKAEQYVQGLFHSLNHGEALPPIRTMVEESGLGRCVIENAIGDLVARQLLETRKRSGIYRTTLDLEAELPEQDRIVDIVACSEINYLRDPRSFASLLVNHLIAQGTEYNYAMRLHHVNYYATISAYVQLIEEKKIRQAFLLLPANDEIVKEFNSRNVHNVVVLPRYRPSQGPAVIDPPNLIELQLKYLFERGHRRIAYIHAVDLGFPWQIALLWRESYYRTMAEQALPVYPEWAVHYSCEEEVLFRRLDGLFHSGHAPTAIIVHSLCLPLLYRYCMKEGIGIGEDVSVIASEEIGTENLYPQPTFVDNNVQAISEMSWQFLLQKSSSQDFCLINYIDLRIHERETISSCRPLKLEPIYTRNDILSPISLNQPQIQGVER